MDNTSNIIDPSARTTVAISVLLAMIGSLLYGAFPDFVEPVRLKWSDLIVAQGPQIDITDRVVVIDIDEQSLEAFGQWPWPRSRLAALLQKINGLKASAVALDFILAEPDRTTPAPSAPEPSGENGPPRMEGDLPDHQHNPDRVLAETLLKGPFVLGYTFAFNDSRRNQDGCHIVPVEIVNARSPARDRNALQIFQARDVVCNLPQFARAATHSGFLNGVRHR